MISMATSPATPAGGRRGPPQRVDGGAHVRPKHEQQRVSPWLCSGAWMVGLRAVISDASHDSIGVAMHRVWDAVAKMRQKRGACATQDMFSL